MIGRHHTRGQVHLAPSVVHCGSGPAYRLAGGRRGFSDPADPHTAGPPVDSQVTTYLRDVLTKGWGYVSMMYLGDRAKGPISTSEIPAEYARSEHPTNAGNVDSPDTLSRSHQR